MRGLAINRLWITLTTTSLSVVVALGTFFPITAKAQGAPAARDFMNTPMNAHISCRFLVQQSRDRFFLKSSCGQNATVSRVRVATILWSFPMFKCSKDMLAFRWVVAKLESRERDPLAT